jgi:hypothetical protein
MVGDEGTPLTHRLRLTHCRVFGGLQLKLSVDLGPKQHNEK